MRTSTGLSTEAVYIFNNMLRKLAKEYQPAYIAAVFESSEPTLRLQEFAEYKGYEADDVIGTIARRAERDGCEVVIVSSDKDMLQLVSDRISMLNPAKD